MIGHSRGGGIGFIKASQDQRIQGMISWAAVSHLDYSWRSDETLLAKWKADGVHYILNGRTGQQMPLYYQLYQDFVSHLPLLDIQHQLTNFEKPLLIIHGDADPAVPLEAAQRLHAWCSQSSLYIIKGANHVFGGSHPYEAHDLPIHTQELVQLSIDFLDRHKKDPDSEE